MDHVAKKLESDLDIKFHNSFDVNKLASIAHPPPLHTQLIPGKAHLKGNYGGILLSAVAVDANNEIYPLAYAIVRSEDKETWAYFFWHLHNIVKQSSREHWTIISDRQKGVDIALKQVWPSAKRRYCCRHLSRNYKKAFPSPLMYTLFWRACNATNKNTFRKAMEKLQKEGGEDVMTWFAELGDQSKWSKHAFDPNVCNDSNTSNFVESFNSTLGVDRCRPVLTLLEGIRRVCMVRIASRHERAQGWEDNDLCPKIAKMVREISKATSTCRAFQSSPGEHAVRAMLHAKVDPHNYVSSWYTARTYKKIYKYVINPVPVSSQWPPADANHPHIHPPKIKRGVGRPSRNRKRKEGEDQLGKRSRTIKCSNCGNLGHNACRIPP
ncbi:uncharacterized protein LOC110732169 [Chenopodium quinoa]|uniref:uncharacterized protein LOC110732169 n=1 Tax=Chenopodium quinoa TaxID=63459 RepID=UPI000B79A302|nr:uncharacterized protein LOC110732169 [Chenopodium quinoa]